MEGRERATGAVREQANAVHHDRAAAEGAARPRAIKGLEFHPSGLGGPGGREEGGTKVEPSGGGGGKVRAGA